jgi:hypothetical protein
MKTGAGASKDRDRQPKADDREERMRQLNQRLACPFGKFFLDPAPDDKVPQRWRGPGTGRGACLNI